MHSASELENTSTTPAQSTDTCVDEQSGEKKVAGALSGFRKRWAGRRMDVTTDSQPSESVSGMTDLFGSERDEQEAVDIPQFLDAPEMDLPVTDVGVDDSSDQLEVLPDIKRQKTRAYEREALSSTDLRVFKYPWERGRLKKFFSNYFSQGSYSETRAGGRCFRFRLSVVQLKVSVEATIDTVLECAHGILDAVFSVKSPGTLMRRLYSIQAFEHWCNDQFNDHWLPVTEYRAWKYVSWLKETGAAPTKASSFLEALRFAWYLLGVEGSGEAEKSLRVKGLASQQRSKKKPWRPADLLKQEEVLRLHSVLADDDAALGDRLFSGHLLHMLYGRCRWSDLTCVTDLFMDADAQFLEVSTRWHKGGRSAEMKARLLPIVAPARGIDQTNWAQIYLQLRERAGLVLQKGEHGPMMRAPQDEGTQTWSARALTSEEGSAFLRKILAAPKTVDRRISTHSMKSTVLSWCSKFGLPDASRAVLARHVSSVSTATAVYSRDLLSPVLRELEGMISSIRVGLFSPDRTRSGMLTPAAQAAGAPATPFLRGMPPAPQTPVPVAVPVQLEVPNEKDDKDAVLAVGESSLGSWEHVEKQAELEEISLCASPSPAECGQEDSDTSEEGSVQSSSSSGEEDETEEPKHWSHDPPSDYYVNVKSLVVHCCRFPGVLKCGRRVSPNFTKAYELNGIRCSRCFDV
eukprot:s975_g27.t1